MSPYQESIRQLKNCPLSADKYQIAAINHDTGPAFVTAGPGSGKTKVLTYRILNLIQRGVLPQNILVLTFSKVAAVEMQKRFLMLYKKTDSAVTFGTFHAVFYKFLKEFNFQVPGIITEKSKYKMIEKIIAGHHFALPLEEEFYAQIIKEISKRKSLSERDGNEETDFMNPHTFQKIHELYEKELHDMNAFDFEDILIETGKLLLHRRDALLKLQNRFQYVLVDEFQDINAIQYEILNYLCDGHKNLFAVGDDDQSIYGFRGAGPEFIERLKEDYPDIVFYPLWNNYRCGEEITAHSVRLIRHNKSRMEKEIHAQSGRKGSVIVKTFPNDSSQFSYICEYLKTVPAKEYNQTVILLRNNIISKSFLYALRKAQIPFRFEGAVSDICESNVAKDLNAYFHLSNGIMSSKDFVRVMNKPYRGFDKDSFTKDYFMKENISFSGLFFLYRTNPYMTEVLHKLQKQIQCLEGLDPYGKITYISKIMGYEEYLKRKSYTEDSYFYKNGDPLLILSALKDEARELKSLKDWEEIYTSERKVQRQDDDSLEKIRIMTMHASKGLEFDRVIIPDITEGNIPSPKSVGKKGLEEERRLFYVAMTRAREELILCTKKTERCKPSRFLSEI